MGGSLGWIWQLSYRILLYPNGARLEEAGSEATSIHLGSGKSSNTDGILPDSKAGGARRQERCSAVKPSLESSMTCSLVFNED